MGPNGPAPTAEDKRWIRAILGFGCVACFLDGERDMPAALHHLVDGNRRIGHRFSLPLCDPGHHQNGGHRGLISLHPGRNPEFIAHYGTELSLLRRLERVLGVPPAPLP
jgi:hypothetical protein